MVNAGNYWLLHQTLYTRHIQYFYICLFMENRYIIITQICRYLFFLSNSTNLNFEKSWRYQVIFTKSKIMLHIHLLTNSKDDKFMVQ